MQQKKNKFKRGRASHYHNYVNIKIYSTIIMSENRSEHLRILSLSSVHVNSAVYIIQPPPAQPNVYNCPGKCYK